MSSSDGTDETGAAGAPNGAPCSPEAASLAEAPTEAPTEPPTEAHTKTGVAWLRAMVRGYTKVLRFCG